MMLLIYLYVRKDKNVENENFQESLWREKSFEIPKAQFQEFSDWSQGMYLSTIM